MQGVPKSTTAQLWDRIAYLVRNNARVKTSAKILQLYEGLPTDLADWDVNNTPAVRITPAGQPSKWSAESQHDAPLIASVELATPSTYAGDLFDLWAAIVSVFFPGDNTVLNSLRQYGVYLISISSPAWSATTLKDGAKALYGQGALKFDTHLNT